METVQRKLNQCTSFLAKKGALAALLQAEEEAYSNHVTAEVASATKHGNKFDGAACATKHGN